MCAEPAGLVPCGRCRKHTPPPPLVAVAAVVGVMVTWLEVSVAWCVPSPQGWSPVGGAGSTPRHLPNSLVTVVRPLGVLRGWRCAPSPQVWSPAGSAGSAPRCPSLPMQSRHSSRSRAVPAVQPTPVLFFPSLPPDAAPLAPRQLPLASGLPAAGSDASGSRSTLRPNAARLERVGRPPRLAPPRPPTARRLTQPLCT